MYIVILLSENISRDILDGRFLINIIKECETEAEAKEELSLLYESIKGENGNHLLSNECKERTSFHLENLDINAMSHTGFIVECECSSQYLGLIVDYTTAPYTVLYTANDEDWDELSIKLKRNFRNIMSEASKHGEDGWFDNNTVSFISNADMWSEQSPLIFEAVAGDESDIYIAAFIISFTK